MSLPCGRSSELYFHPSLREAWRRGTLVEVWADEYPFLFDADNRRNAWAARKRGYYFGEWFAAIALCRRFGLYAVVGKYAFLSHARKTATFERLVTDQALRDFLRRGRVDGKRLKRPDLLVYPPDFSDYWFIEVKREDHLTPEQIRHFDEIERQTGAPWGEVRLRPCPVPACTTSCFTCDGPPNEKEQ